MELACGLFAVVCTYQQTCSFHKFTFKQLKLQVKFQCKNKIKTE
jgi:hypothetical protein